MNQKLVAAQRLQEQLGLLIQNERELLNQILDLIIEADLNRSYLILGYSTLFAWLTKQFKYSESSAKRRIDAARVKAAVPSIEQKIENGSVNVTTISKVQSAIRAEEIRTNTKMTSAQKEAVIEKIENKTGVEAEKILMQEFPTAQIFVKERARVVSAEEIQVQILLSHEDFEILQRAKELLSHSIPDGGLGKVVAALCREFVLRKDPKRSAKRNQSPSATSVDIDCETASGDRSLCNAETAPSDKHDRQSSSPRSRYVPQPIRRAIFRRDDGSCQYRSPLTGKLCGSRFQIEIDHIQPWALGGSNELENLRCLCAHHNRQRAIDTFGDRRSS